MGDTALRLALTWALRTHMKQICNFGLVTVFVYDESKTRLPRRRSATLARR